MAIKTLLQRFDTSYSVAKTIAPGNGGTTDFRDYCNDVNEFQEFYDAYEQEIRQEGLITYEISSGKTKRCRKQGDGWVWDIIPTTVELESFNKRLEDLESSSISGYYIEDEPINSIRAISDDGIDKVTFLFNTIFRLKTFEWAFEELGVNLPCHQNSRIYTDLSYVDQVEHIINNTNYNKEILKNQLDLYLKHDVITNDEYTQLIEIMN